MTASVSRARGGAVLVAVAAGAMLLGGVRVASATVPVPAVDSLLGCGPDADTDAADRDRGWTLLPARWEPDPMLRLVVNIPAFRLDLIEDGVTSASFRISPGMRRYRTPRGSFSVDHIEWNPWWIPPSAEWAKNDTITPPGSRNPMGRVKLGFAPYYYLHGTPFEKSLGTAASHGCVRLANADVIALARRLHRQALPATTDAAIDSLVADSTRTMRVELLSPVPLEIRYDVVEVVGDSIRIHPDVYRLVRGRYRELVVLALSSAGHDTMTVDARRLAGVIRRGQRNPVTIAVRELWPDIDRAVGGNRTEIQGESDCLVLSRPAILVSHPQSGILWMEPSHGTPYEGSTPDVRFRRAGCGVAGHN